MVHRRAILGVSLVATAGFTLAGCATTGGASGAFDYEDDLSILDVETDPRWLGMLYEEADDLTAFQVAAPDGSWSATALAAEAPTQDPDHPRVVRVSIGSGRSMARCHLLGGRASVATVVRDLANRALATGGKQEVKYLAVHPREVPVLVAHGLLSGGPAAGNYVAITYVKVVAAIGPAGSAVCEHYGFGYRETIERVAVSLARSLRWAAPEAEPALVEVVVARRRPVAIRRALRLGEEHAPVTVLESRLQPSGRTEVGAVDRAETYSIEGGAPRLRSCRLRRDGVLQEAAGDAASGLGCGESEAVAAAAALTP